MCLKQMNVLINNYQITLIDEPTYSRNSTDNVRSYKTELCRDTPCKHVSAHGVIVGDLESPEASAILLGIGGATQVHRNSIVHNSNLCFVASGDSVFALRIPTLEMQWCQKVDSATCFGVYWLEDADCLITWGELEVCRFTESGKKVWSASGADIFTEGFGLQSKYIEVTDFNYYKYKIDIVSGKIDRIKI